MSDSPRSTSSSAPPNLHAALLDFCARPGTYQLTLREPAVLFSSIREVLQIAAGRQAGEAGDAGARKLQDAASFFVRNALLYPGADHYAVLGLPVRTEAADLKDRYRLLMRLIHPDFAPPGSNLWPTDAAVRVNRAYEVLSSPVLRRDYDEQLEACSPVPRAVVVKRAPDQPPPPPRSELARGKLARTLAWMLASFAGLVAAVTLFSKPEPVQLVQRATEPAEGAATTVAQAQIPTPMAAPMPAPIPAPAPAASVAEFPKLVEDLDAAWAEATTVLRSAALPPVQRPPQAAPAKVAAHPAPAPHPAATHAMLHSAPPAASFVPAAAPEPAVQHASVRDRVTEAVAPAPMPAATARNETVAAAPAPVREAAAAAPAQVAAVAPRPAPAPAPMPIVQGNSPSLTDVQPLLTQLLERMESGSGEQMLRLLLPDARSAASAQAVQRQYDLLVRGARRVRLAQVEFASETRGGILAVTSRVRLHAGEPTIGSFGERFAVRAEFVARDGKVVMTSLSGVGD